ncbi:molybdopterin-guanine dinucleotide biosynthesis protein B [Pseudobacteriovorax antillogorgiicola]|uniref:Probable molybdenum cofactor guanylyltransferase n=1 Tax=Pseudobacteriovorax antillogorgiicola TaxID=1513793 RepID=A0A1Y6CFW6_9BACT|nr:molybdopterin-guanine dinucleotide biosynthesis protein B [Pseudobacteriovorax antillogorgiicola]TCS49013.1 molybdopterin-guanine dinucleotide biosynthesis protein MobB [Pseudobacteriovorax antillogorgiicola]SMF53049.1 molybdopterin-guanine dinucleotide biosynthesis protein MobB [Pseudobacteriovorax antillogorgiicola]
MSRKKAKHLYHPTEIAIAGYSGSGKTTLICQLLNIWRNSYRVAYIKHDAHRFVMDRPGKDTSLAWQAGAEQVFIADQEHFASLSRGTSSMFQQRSMSRDFDFALVEGHKASKIPKLLFWNPELKPMVNNGEITEVLAWIGEPNEHPDPEGGLPYFRRDDVAAIAHFIAQNWQEVLQGKPLSGLVLTGGQSSRMGQDKALLRYGDKPQAQVAFDLLEQNLEEVYISSRPGQWQGTPLAELPQISDRFEGFGPMGGILSAMLAFPERSWLVVACDLPRLDPNTIERLINERQATQLATCYRSLHDGLPEPLCAIYESRMKERLFEALGQGIHCPRKVLIHSASKVLELGESNTLENINYQSEYQAFKEQGALT